LCKEYLPCEGEDCAGFALDGFALDGFAVGVSDSIPRASSADSVGTTVISDPPEEVSFALATVDFVAPRVVEVAFVGLEPGTGVPVGDAVVLGNGSSSILAFLCMTLVGTIVLSKPCSCESQHLHMASYSSPSSFFTDT